jgi:hypothetical protein
MSFNLDNGPDFQDTILSFSLKRSEPASRHGDKGTLCESTGSRKVVNDNARIGDRAGIGREPRRGGSE